MTSKRDKRRKVIRRHLKSYTKDKSRNVNEAIQIGFDRTVRKVLQKKGSYDTPPQPTSTVLKFASLNINGIDLEAEWFINEVLKTRGLDVRIY